MNETYRTIKIKHSTYRALKVLAAKRGETMLDLLDRLVTEENNMRTYIYTLKMLDDITSTDLHAEARAAMGDAQAATITIYKANGQREAEAAEALWLPSEGRLGIAWGADATWADVRDLESGIEMWLNDGEAWTAAN